MKKKNLLLNGMAFFVCLFLFVGLSAQTTKSVLVTSSGTWTVPTTLDGSPITVTSVTFEAWGGGGAGGYAFSTGILKASGGGGGGAYAKSATITDMTPGETFNITVGAGGTAIGDDPDHFTVVDGGNSSVYRGSTPLANAVGGKTVTGAQNVNGAAGGSASDCSGVVVHSGGKGGNAYGGLTTAFMGWSTGAWCISGSGGGAGGPDADGGNANNSEMRLSPSDLWNAFVYGGDMGQITGLPGSSSGNPDNGSGAWGRESQILGGGGWGNAQGNAGNKYGGGGGGAIGNGLSWGDANGGQGGQGVVRVTYTYVGEEIAVSDAETTVCSDAEYDVTLNVTVDGFSLQNAQITGTKTDVTGITGGDPTFAYNTSDSKWHVTGTATNSTSETKTFTINGTAKTQHDAMTVNFTVTVNVYGKLDGGVIGVDQAVCNGLEIQTLKGDGTSLVSPYYGNITTALASGGSGSGIYRWYRNTYDIATGWSGYEIITGANVENYTPSGEGYFRFMREYVDNVCGTTVFASDGQYADAYLNVVTELPFTWDETYSSNDTICSNETYTFDIDADTESPFYHANSGYLVYNYQWRTQISTDKGATWNNTSSAWDDYDLHPTYTPADFQPGDDIWYRVVHKFNDCDSIPSNAIYKLHVKEIPDYTGQFPDVNITLWYGACDTSITALVPPTLTPTPASITRADAYGDRLTPGEYVLRWNVIADDCNIPVEYTQNVKVEYPACGTLTEPLTMTDNDGKEYQTIRIGCECWMAENLRTNAPDAVYYDEDPANEQFGKLYTWADAVGCNETPKETKSGATYVQGILPNEWSIPTMEQYNKLLLYFNTEELKSDETGTWLPDHLGTNASGFNLKAGGYYDVVFQRMLGYADFWVVGATSTNPDKAPVAEIRYDCDGTINCVFKQKTAKMSVRGVRVSPK